MHERLISEAISPVAGTGDVTRMAIGEPGLPHKFEWRGRTVTVTAVWSRSSIVDTKSIMLPAAVRSIDVQTLPVKDSPVASEDAVDCRTLQYTR